MKIRYEWEQKDVEKMRPVMGVMSRKYIFIKTNLMDGRGIVYSLVNYEGFVSTEWYNTSGMANYLNINQYTPWKEDGD